MFEPDAKYQIGSGMRTGGMRPQRNRISCRAAYHSSAFMRRDHRECDARYTVRSRGHHGQAIHHRCANPLHAAAASADQVAAVGRDHEVFGIVARQVAFDRSVLTFAQVVVEHFCGERC